MAWTSRAHNLALFCSDLALISGMAESNFRTNDPGSWTSDGRACGIAQSLPCDKMGPGSNNDGHTELTAWEQVVWMLVYIRDRYGNPNNAWIHEYNHSWY
jgi:hypothetical protein